MFEDLKEFFKDNGLMLIKASLGAAFALLLVGAIPAFITTGDRALDVMIMLYTMLFIAVLCSFARNVFKYTKNKTTKGKNKNDKTKTTTASQRGP